MPCRLDPTVYCSVMKSETCQFSKSCSCEPSEYRLGTVSIVSKYGLDGSAVRFGLVPNTVSL